MKRRPDSTPTFWLGDPPPMLPRGQLDLPLVQAPKVEPLPELRECDACGEDDDPDAMIENERGAVICTECQEADEHYESTYSPESDAYFDGGE